MVLPAGPASPGSASARPSSPTCARTAPGPPPSRTFSSPRGHALDPRPQVLVVDDRHLPAPLRDASGSTRSRARGRTRSRGSLSMISASSRCCARTGSRVAASNRFAARRPMNGISVREMSDMRYYADEPTGRSIAGQFPWNVLPGAPHSITKSAFSRRHERPSQSERHDVVVVGAGAFGAWTALALRRRGRRRPPDRRRTGPATAARARAARRA